MIVSYKLRYRVISCVLVAACAICCAQAGAAQSPDSYFQKVIGRLKSLKTYKVTLNDTVLLQPTAQGAKPRSIESTSQVVYKSPNLFFLNNNGPMGSSRMVSDGKQELIYSDFTQQYVIVAAPADVFDQILGGMFGRKAVWTAEKSAKIDGMILTELAGTVKSGRGNMLITLYIKANSLPYKAVLVIPAFQSPTGSGLQVTRTEIFADERVNQAVQDSVFKFAPPSGATRVKNVSELAGGLGGGGL
jgi:outer membrane lipoprotein-sorting protein